MTTTKREIARSWSLCAACLLLTSGCYRSSTQGTAHDGDLRDAGIEDVADANARDADAHDAAGSDAHDADAHDANAAEAGVASRAFLLGWPVLDGHVGLIGPGTVGAQRVELDVDATLDAIDFVAAAGGVIRVAVYEDANGQPGRLVSGSAREAIALTHAGRHRIDLEDAPLARGVYWLVVGAIGYSAHLATNASTPTHRCVIGLSSMSAWPADFGDDAHAQCNPSTPHAVNVYAELYVGSPPAPELPIDGGSTGGEISLGFEHDLGGALVHPPAAFRGLAIDITTPITLDALGVVLRSAEGYIRLALYDDHEGKPRHALAVTNAWHVTAVGPQRIDVIDIHLEPGRYWLAFTSAASTTIASTVGSVTAPACTRYVSFMQSFIDYAPTSVFTCDPSAPAWNGYLVGHPE